MKKLERYTVIFCLIASFMYVGNYTCFGAIPVDLDEPDELEVSDTQTKEDKDYIKWMEFSVPDKVLRQAYLLDVKSQSTEHPVDFVELVAYGAAKNWGKLSAEKECKEIDSAYQKIQDGATMDELTEGIKLYPFYYKAYSAVLGGFIGEYDVTETSVNGETSLEEKSTLRKYGLKVFSPIPKGYSYTHYDDFGNSRSYGYKRKHLGNDIMGSIGTPIIAVEDGRIEALGWNQYGGWRVGIRSRDNNRYYYYAHLRKDHPYPKALKEGDNVKAGDVIGYLGMTGYSKKENVNNIKIPHLHFGIEIIFDETQKDGYSQIWIDAYQLVNFLSQNQMQVEYDSVSKDYHPAKDINEVPND